MMNATSAFVGIDVAISESLVKEASVSDAVERAARLISECDLLVVYTGAGMSADSGLKVYADVAKVPIYEQNNLDYSDLCNPQLLRDSPKVFLGFWGAECFNAYQDTQPHEGYSILKKWGRQVHQDHRLFVITANVDGHSVRSGLTDERHCLEIHGGLHTWQCQEDDCGAAEGRFQGLLYRAPAGYRFSLESRHSMLCLPLEQAPLLGDAEAVVPSGCEGWFASGQQSLEAFSGDFPRCLGCRELLRPAVLMFYDREWIQTAQQESCYAEWHDVWLPGYLAAKQDASVVVLEIGAGLRVPTIRRQAETETLLLRDKGYRATLIRVNPTECETERLPEQLAFCVPMKGLEALKAIDEQISRMKE